MDETSSTPDLKSNKKIFRITFILLVVLCVIVGSVATYFYQQYQSVRAKANQATKNEVETLMAELSTMTELPLGEVPSIATVTDLNKLADQPFFHKAQVGDKVVIYTQAGEALLYRPVTKKLLTVMPIDGVNATSKTDPIPASLTAPAVAGETTQSPEPVTTSPIPEMPEKKSLQVVFLNGSTTVGVTQRAEDQLKAAFPEMEVMTKEKAARPDYTGVTVVDVTGAHADEAASVATLFRGTVGVAPEEETIPERTDILILMGNK